MRRLRQVDLVLPMIAILVAGCGSTVSTPGPTGSSAASPSATGTPLASATATPDPLLGSVVVTVSDRLRVRSAPEVSEASVKYEPLLPLGTELRVIGGPVSGSGYVWYEVTPVSLVLADGVEHGWVAMADHDGEPWIARADEPIAGLEVVKSAIARDPADSSGARSASASVAGFGLELYREMLAGPLALSNENVVISPTSIALALGMARAGARTETGRQMDTVLHTSGWDDLGAGLNALDQVLASRDRTYLDDEGNAHELTLRIANASFAQRGWPIEQTYLDALASAFGAGLNLVDYASDPEAARRTINAWVSQKTEKRIAELLAPPNVSTQTRLYLVNAVYLKANWVAEFPVSATESRAFTRLGGALVTVPTMRLDGGQEVPYLRGDGWQATELRYRGANGSAPLAMTLIMPDDLPAFEADLSPEQLATIESDLTRERTRLSEAIENTGEPEDCGTYPYSLELFMPRFKVATRANLADPLGALGMPLAFDPVRADFRGIHVPASGDDAIYISAVIHQANVAVDEKGTEAAAATAVGFDTGGCTGPQPGAAIALHLDRPFFFVLRDVESGAVLFMGRVIDPTVTG